MRSRTVKLPMSKLLTLSDGTEVHLKEKFTHKAEMAYSAARDKGTVDRETVEDGKIKAIRETPVVNYADAIEASLLVMIERVKKGDAESTPTTGWFNELEEGDYDALARAMLEIRKAGRERGKKST